MLFDYEFAEKIDNWRKKYNSNSFCNKIAPLMPKMFKLLNFLKENINQEIINFPKIDFSLREMKQMALKFFEEINPKFSETIQKTLKRKSTFLFENEPNGNGGRNSVEVYDKFLQVNLNPVNTTLGVVAVAHEFTHILENSAQNLNPQFKDDSVTEIASLFIEKVFKDYLFENGIINEREFKLLKIFDAYSFINNLSLVCEEFEIFDRLKKINGKVTPRTLQIFEMQIYDNPKYDALMNRLHTMTKIDNENNNFYFGSYVYRYVVGELISKSFQQDFKKEPISSLAKFAEFLKINDSLSLQESAEFLLGENCSQKIKSTFLSQNKELR